MQFRLSLNENTKTKKKHRFPCKLKYIIIDLVILIYISQSFGYTITGTIEGGLYNQGLTIVCAYSEIPDSLTVSSYNSVLYYGIGNFYLFEVPAGDYILLAFQDLNGNNLPDSDDYMGYYGDLPPEVIHLSSNLSGLNITLSDQPAGFISGEISYSGQLSGPAFVEAYDNSMFAGNPIGFGILYLPEHQQMVFSQNGNGDYQDHLPEGTYYLRAYMDLDFSFTSSEDEPYGEYSDLWGPIAINIAEDEQLTDIDFTMSIQTVINQQGENTEDVPADFSIVSVYPNPFNCSTTISIRLLHSSPIRIVLHNILGKRTAILAESIYPKGLHDLRFDSLQFPTGVYFVSIIASDIVYDRRKIVILK